jgi:hypothetical protein
MMQVKTFTKGIWSGVQAPGWLLVFATLFMASTAFAQEPKKEWEGDGEIEDVEIEIVKERQITLPKANRNFDKIPPRASEPIKPPISYDFQAFNFQAPPINAQIRPLKIRQEQPSKVYGGFLRLGFGNYTSPLIEGYLNSTRAKNKLVGIHAYHTSSDKGPVDDKNSGSGSSGVSVYGKSFNQVLALSGTAGFENRSTHFYGYPEGTDVSASDIKQSFNRIHLSGDLSNSKNKDFSYRLGAGFSHLSDKYDARETEVSFNFKSAYEMGPESKIHLKADYFIISRKDVGVEVKPRNLLIIAPSYEIIPIEDFNVTVGLIVAFENDSIDAKNLHVYPDIKATYPLSPSVDVVGTLTGGIEKVSLSSMSNENLWLEPDIPIFHTNKALEFGVGLNAKLGNKVSTHTGISFASLKNLYYFVNSEADQSKFTAVFDGDAGTRRANLYAALSYAQSEKAKVMLRGDFYGYTTSTLDEAWHRPTYKLSLNAFYNLYDKILFNADFITQGGMRAFDPVTDATVKLESAIDLNVKVEYLFSNSFSAFLQFNNITSSKYPIFLHYPVRGFQLMAGITWSF